MGLVCSEVLMDEIEQMPDTQKLSCTKLLSGFIQENIEIGEKEEQRAGNCKPKVFKCLTLCILPAPKAPKRTCFYQLMTVC